MFGRKREGREAKERPPFNPRSRVSLYAMGGLYLGYLLYQLVGPYLGEAGTAPSVPTLLLGILVLGGGMAALFYLAWKMYQMPDPVEDETALPEESPSDGEKDGGADDGEPG